MIKGGKGGANTKTGLHFEERVSFCDLIGARNCYSVENGRITYNGEEIAQSLKKHDLYKFLESRGLSYKEIISKKLLPDDAIFVPAKNKIFIIEIKFQDVAGSTDEKLQTCDFKIKQYRKIFGPLGIDVEYIYVLNDWFRKPEYKDVLDYISSIDGCSYYFNELPLSVLGMA